MSRYDKVYYRANREHFCGLQRAYYERNQERFAAQGAALKEYRLAAGVTQCDLAKALGCSYVTIHNYETGKSPCSAERYLRALSDASGRSVKQLMQKGAVQ